MDNQNVLDLLAQLVGEVKGLNNRFDNLENKFDNLENRFDNLENKFDNLENRFDNLENNVKDLKKNMNDRFDVIDLQLNATQKMVLMNKDSNKRLSEQIESNMEALESLKLNH